MAVLIGCHSQFSDKYMKKKEKHDLSKTFFILHIFAICIVEHRYKASKDGDKKMCEM